jgi:HEAT repeat protein
MTIDHRPNIWQLQAQRDSKALIEALQNEDRDIRQRAASALRILGAAEALPTLRRLLADERDPATRTHLEGVIESLLQEQPEGTLPMSDAARALVARLQSSDPAVIVKAARDLGRLKDKTSVEALILLFHNTQLPERVRLSAAEALIELESAPAVVTLLAALKSQSWQIRRNGVAVLGQLRAEWAVERIAERLQDENEHVRRTALAALKRIDSKSAHKAIDAYQKSLSKAVPAPDAAPAPAETSPVPAAAPDDKKPAS